MKRLSALTFVAMTVFAALAATVRLAAQEPQPNTSTTQQSLSFTVLHNFSGSDGANPFAGLVMDSTHNLYGTTVNGGPYGTGTVFKLGPSKHDVTVLYSFTGGSDGKWPVASVIPDRAGNLYGTTHSGDDYGNGTVFKLDTFGNETVLYSFTGGSDGSVPLAGLIMDNAGNLYGTTYVGGAYNSGTVFKLGPSGNETVLYTFTGGSDGGGPYGGEGFRDKIAKPLTGLIVTRVIGVLECLEKLCKSLRPSTVFGRTTSFTRHACLLKRFVSKQDFFKKKLVLPAVPEIVLVQ